MTLSLGHLEALLRLRFKTPMANKPAENPYVLGDLIEAGYLDRDNETAHVWVITQAGDMAIAAAVVAFNQ